MSYHPQIISAAVAVFVVAALLWFATRSGDRREGFAGYPIAPVAGRPYGAIGELADDSDRVPADLNRAPIVLPHPVNVVPPSGQRPVATPGAPTAPKEAMATRKDLNELDSKILTWLAAATQRETEYPGSLTAVQRQRRIMLQSRHAEVLEQLGTDLITDTYKRVAEEIATLRREIAGWGRTARGIEAIHDFAKDAPAEALLTPDQYAEFRELFYAILNDYRGHTQPDPLQRVRTQQLQVIAQSLPSPATPQPQPAIRVGAARLFLVQATRPDQPLPTLMDPAVMSQPQTQPIANPADIISQLRDISWRLTISYDSPATAALKQQVAGLLAQLQGRPSPVLVETARSSVVELQNQLAGTPLAATGRAPPAAATYDPSDLTGRAARLCFQLREAVGPSDAVALGCPASATATADRFVAETTINTVCERIRTSVPSLSPAQFNCPLPGHTV